MNRKSLIVSTLALMLSATTLSAFADSGQQSLVGNNVPVSAATRTIVINKDTNYVNVTGGEVVKFVVGDKSFAWDFHVASTVYHADLTKLAPNGIIDHEVMVYIAPDPTYRG